MGSLETWGAMGGGRGRGRVSWRLRGLWRAPGLLRDGGGVSAGGFRPYWAQGGAVGFLGTQELEWRGSGLPREKWGGGFGGLPG